MKRYWFVVVLVLAVLVGCSGGESAVSTSVALTLEAQPTNAAVPTATPAPTDTPEPTPTPTPEPTNTPEPTITSSPTPVSLEAINLEEVIVVEGDLPSHLSPTVSSDSELLSQNINLGDIPLGVNFLNQNLHNENRDSNGGGIIIFVYDDMELVSSAFATTKSGVRNNALLSASAAGVGDDSLVATDPPQTHLTFIRCHAVVYIWMIDATEDQVVAYAQRLDGRLSELVC